MKALTICQPYAELIVRGTKRVENRTWPTSYRGPLLIHAGKSREWLTDDGPNLDPRENYGIPLEQMTFGAFIGSASMIDCVKYSDVLDGKYRDKYPWLTEHEHASGPWCWVMERMVRLANPVPWRGAQGLWDADYDKVRGRSLTKGDKP